MLGLATAIAVLGLNLARIAIKEDNSSLLLAIAPFSPHAAAQAAEIALIAGHPAEAERLARRALRFTPISAQALRVLGLARQQQGKMDQAYEAMALTAGLGWRDTPTQLWLIQTYLAQGDVAAALERADALARQEQFRSEMMRLFLAAAGVPETRSAVITRLAGDPPWRALFFAGWRQIPPQNSTAYSAFLNDLARSEGSLKPYEIGPFVSGLFDRGEYGLAYTIWRRFIPDPDAASGAALLADGGFSGAALKYEQSRGPFQWFFPSTAGIDIDLTVPPGSGKGAKALFVQSNGDVRAPIARQTVVLAPGSYTLLVDAMAEDGYPPQGFLPKLDCVSPARKLELTQVAAKQYQPAQSQNMWTRFSYTFQIPESCPAQYLSLILRSYQPQPLRLWFDNLAIRRLAG